MPTPFGGPVSGLPYAIDSPCVSDEALQTRTSPRRLVVPRRSGQISLFGRVLAVNAAILIASVAR